jgi:hypothetical protein
LAHRGIEKGVFESKNQRKSEKRKAGRIRIAVGRLTGWQPHRHISIGNRKSVRIQPVRQELSAYKLIRKLDAGAARLVCGTCGEHELF